LGVSFQNITANANTKAANRLLSKVAQGKCAAVNGNHLEKAKRSRLPMPPPIKTHTKVMKPIGQGV
jgi:hypothetical protein